MGAGRGGAEGRRVLLQADQLMYGAKSQGRNTWQAASYVKEVAGEAGNKKPPPRAGGGGSSEVVGHAQGVATTIQHGTEAGVIHRLVEQVVDTGGDIQVFVGLVDQTGVEEGVGGGTSSILTRLR